MGGEAIPRGPEGWWGCRILEIRAICKQEVLLGEEEGSVLSYSY